MGETKMNSARHCLSRVYQRLPASSAQQSVQVSARVLFFHWPRAVITVIHPSEVLAQWGLTYCIRSNLYSLPTKGYKPCSLMMGEPLPINHWFQWCLANQYLQKWWLHFQCIRMIILPSFTAKPVIHHLIVPASNVEKWPSHTLVQHPRRELPRWYLGSTSSL